MYAIPEFKGPFHELIPEFIRYKRALGYSYGKNMVCRLAEMNRFLLQNRLISEIAIPESAFNLWISLRNNETTSNQEKRYTAIHGFAKFLIQNGYQNIFDSDNPVCKHNDFVPYIYSKEEISKLFEVSDSFKTESMAYIYRHGAMLPVILRLLYSTGMRISEVLALKLKDVEWKSGRINIRDGKNHVNRMISVSASMKHVLDEYRKKISFFSNEDFLFHGRDNRPYSYGIVHYVFRQVLKAAGIVPRASGKYPRIHDLRHGFAILALEQMELQGYDMYTSLPLLSKYLGHKTIVETEHYVRLTKSSLSKITTAAADYSPDLFPRMVEDCDE